MAYMMNGNRVSKEGEVWRPIPGYERDYEVSNFGRVWSYFKYDYIVCKGDKNGYLRVALVADRIPKTKKIHRLVLSTFKPILGWEKKQVNHKDCNKKNNHLDNLEWVTCKENNRHARANVEFKSVAGLKNYAAKFTPENLKDIADMYLSGIKCTRIAKKHDVCVGAIYELIRGVSYVEEFKPYFNKIVRYKKNKLLEEKNKKHILKLKREIYKTNDITVKQQKEILKKYFDQDYTIGELCQEFNKHREIINIVLGQEPKDSKRRCYKRSRGVQSQSGSQNGRSKLKPEQVKEIVRRFKSGVNKSQLSREYGISRTNILKIVEGKLWSSVTGIIYIKGGESDTLQ